MPAHLNRIPGDENQDAGEPEHALIAALAGKPSPGTTRS